VVAYSGTPTDPVSVVINVLRWQDYTGVRPSNEMPDVPFDSRWMALSSRSVALKNPVTTDRLLFPDVATAEAWLDSAAGKDYTRGTLLISAQLG